MTSLHNTYFIKGHSGEQGLIESMTTEAIQVNGHLIYYLPRILQKKDLIFGEDVLSKFDTALPIEMYVDTYQGWEGEQEIISKFGLEIRKRITFIVSRTRWATEVQKIASKMWVSSRPQEGDLIFDPQTKMLFQINFIDQDDVFLQGYKYYTYKIQCEMFQYNQEEFTTGIAYIDAVPITEMSNLLDYVVLAEDGSPLLDENGNYIYKEEMVIEDNIFDDSNHYATQAPIIEFSVDNPFGGL